MDAELSRIVGSLSAYECTHEEEDSCVEEALLVDTFDDLPVDIQELIEDIEDRPFRDTVPIEVRMRLRPGYQGGQSDEDDAIVAHAGCDVGVLCRNPLHPGPCRGWRQGGGSDREPLPRRARPPAGVRRRSDAAYRYLENPDRNYRRADEIDKARPYAAFAAQMEADLGNDASDRAILHRISAARRAGLDLDGLTDDVVADRTTLRSWVRARAGREGIALNHEVGATVPYEPQTMRSESNPHPREGTPVFVRRPGQTLYMGDEEIMMEPTSVLRL